MAIGVDDLRRVPFLAPLKDKVVRQLAGSMSERTVVPGEEVVVQDHRGIAFFIVLRGELQVLVDGQARRSLGPGDHFGEIALVVPDALRTATVVASTDASLGAMTSWNFKAFVAEHPEVTWPLLEVLARRVADTPGA